MTRGYVDGRWGQVHYRADGPADGRPLILLHQSPLSGAMFEPAMGRLAEAAFFAVAPDTAGYGLSDPPPRPATIAEYADALVVFLDALGLKRVDLLGHHTGAAIAARFAASRPDRVGRLILNGVPLLSAAERTHFGGMGFAPIVPEAGGGHLLAAWKRRLAASPGWSDLAAMHKHTLDMLRVGDRWWWALSAAISHDMADDLAAIGARTLILTNTGDDLHEASLRSAALRPDFAIATLEGSTHDIVDEQPESWTREVVRFLKA